MQPSAFQTLDGNAQPAQSRNWLLLALVMALVLLLLVGLVAIAAYFVLSNQRSGQIGWQNPLNAVDVTRVRPDIAVLALLDEPTSSVVQEALAAGEPDSAYAALAFDPALSDAERSGNLLLIARAFEEAQANDLAAIAYQQIHTLAALSVTLPDIIRAQSSLEVAGGLIEMGRPDAARPSLAQAEALARYSSLLAPVKRQEIAQTLTGLYRQAGFNTQARELAQLVRQPQGLPDARLVRGPFLPTFQADILLPEQLIQAENNRRRQVMAFLDAWDSSAGQDVEAARAALASALLQEDGIRQAVIAAEIEASPQLSVKAAWVQERIDWLTLKTMIARQAMGISLVPEWELDAENIRGALSSAYDQLFTLYDDMISSLPDAADIGFARIEALRAALLLGRLGLYPDYFEEVLAADLDERQTEMADQLPLLIVHEPWGDGRIFRLAASFE